MSGDTTIKIAMAEPTVSAPAELLMCSKCLCRPTHPNSMFDDWCADCDLEQQASQEYVERCVRAGLPRPPVHPIRHSNLICPCGFFAVRNKPLARRSSGQDHLPVHMIVTVPLSDTAHIFFCLICEKTFKHHHHALKHVRSHHAHFHAHHGK